MNLQTFIAQHELTEEQFEQLMHDLDQLAELIANYIIEQEKE